MYKIIEHIPLHGTPFFTVQKRKFLGLVWRTEKQYAYIERNGVEVECLLTVRFTVYEDAQRYIYMQIPVKLERKKYL